VTKRETDKLDAYVTRLQARLGLSGWSITRHYYADDHLPEEARGDHDGDHCIGTSDAWSSIEQATINVARDAEEPATRIARHEMFHVLLAPLQAAMNGLREQVAPPAWEIAFGVFNDAEELAVRRLTRALDDDEEEE